MTAMGNLLAALLKKTGISGFFTGVSVELPAYLLPNFKVVEIECLQVPRMRTSKTAN